jgi:hypothetical protein
MFDARREHAHYRVQCVYCRRDFVRQTVGRVLAGVHWRDP